MEVREQLERAMAAMEAQRSTLGDAVVDAALAALREKLAALPAPEQTAQVDSGPIDGPRRLVTVLFAEVMAPAGQAQDLAHQADAAFWQQMEALVTRAGGLVGRHNGNGIVAIFGVQAAHVDDPERAVRTALEMVNGTHSAGGGEHPGTVQVRAGLHSGPVLVGAGGEIPAAAALGETVNLASRLLEAAAPGEVLISLFVLRAVRAYFDVQAMEPLPAAGGGNAGEAETIPVYRVRGARSRNFRLASGVPGGTGLVAPLVGRDSEISRLQEAFESARAEKGMRSIILTGEAGMGKSRLVHEFLNRLDRRSQPYILLRGRGDWQLNSLPYALLRELLAFRLKIHDGDSAAIAREKLQKGIEEYLGPEGIETAHWIGHLTGWDFNQSPYLANRLDDPRRARQLAFQALNRYVFAIAGQAPLVILADDLQWADEGSLDWLDFLARSDPGGPVLVVGLARPVLFDRRPNWGERWPGQDRLKLLPLADRDSATLAGLLLRGALSFPVTRPVSHSAPTTPRRPGQTGPLGDPLGAVIAEPVEKIVERAGGNPFFLEELAQAFLEADVFQPTGAGPFEPAWRVDTARLETGLMPVSLVEVLQARLDELPPGERAVAQRAAVVGPVFWESAVRALLDAAVGSPAGDAEEHLLHALDLPGALQDLQARGIIYKRDTSAFEHTDEYAFKNALMYEVAYESQLVRWRRRDHARVAGWLAAQSGERVEAYAAVIAGHYERADERHLAADWYGLAAMQARHSSAPGAALRFFHQALELLPDEPGYFSQRVSFFKGIWDVQWWQGRYAEALATGQALLASAEAHGDSSVQAAAWNRVAAVQNRQGEYQAALRSVQRAERLARSGGAAREVVLALFNRGVTLYRLGDAAAALEAGERALAFNQTLFGQSGSSGQDASQAVQTGIGPAAQAGVGQAAHENADLERASEMVKEAGRQGGQDSPMAAWETARETARILNLLAMINQRAGRYKQADGDYQQVLKLQRERGDRAAVMTTLNSLGMLAHQQGDYPNAASYFTEAFNLSHEMGFQEMDLVCLNNLAAAQVEQGEYSQAEVALREVLRRTANSNWFLLTEVYRSLALALMGQDRCEEALQAGLRALELARQQHLNEHIGRAWRVLGRVSAAIEPKAGCAPPGSFPVMVDGKACGAHDCFAASLQIFVEMSATNEQARTARAMAMYELDHGDRQEGVRLWQEARDLFARLGLQLEVERMDRAAPERGES
jgi:class 3 adenylate cyclase/tetratricopeptide (TPR) repeat protein